MAAGGCAGSAALPPTAAPTPEARVQAVVGTPPVDQAHWGVLAVDRSSGRVLVDVASRRKFIPASNVKIPVTVAALDLLGPNHRFATEVRGTGPFAEGVLRGDLVVVASGDPTLSARFWPGDRAPLEALADSLWAAGVRAVEGGLVVDASAWDSTSVADSWMWGNIPWGFSASPGVFAVAEGATTLTGRGGAPGEDVPVTASPAGTEDFVRADVVTGDPGSVEDVTVTWLPESRRLHVQGTVPPGATWTTRVSTRDPVRQGAAALLRVLEVRGILVRDGWTVAWEEGAVPPGEALARLHSPPLLEIVRGVLEPSQNWMAEQLVHALGASDSTRGGWSTGLAAVTRHMVEVVGVDSLDVQLHDGSGLSAYNVLTPRAVTAVVRYALGASWGAGWRAALAEPGEPGSTLESRLLPLRGRLWAKTGTIANVNALSGVVVTAGGRDVLFSILTNGAGEASPQVRAAIDAVVRALAEERP